MVKAHEDNKSLDSLHNDVNLLHTDTGIQMNKNISVGRKHVESEESLNSVLNFPQVPFEVKNFVTGKHATAQVLSVNEGTGESTQRVVLKKGWNAPVGHFTTDVEIFVLTGVLCQGGFLLRNLSYSFIPAGIPTGPWKTEQDTILLWMPDATPTYITEDYANLQQTPENSVYHANMQTHERMTEYVPLQEFHAMKWESTTFLPPGSARKSLYTNKKTGRATWILGLVPMWTEGNFYAGHPTTEEAYVICGDVLGHWSMNDDPFNRRYTAMCKDGYYWRPAHIPHGPFWTENGALLLFRTNDRLDCYWILHNPDITQQDQSRLQAALDKGLPKN
ncbi:DUF4437 domain-containing protein [Scytonema sp. UIC 10036]|uniref:DUF4437 domain-containing protein n=1 Tax=Scytonema sp. UIC 10036 TaxID=2304196 RepID=UPI0012DA3542|nr:DUF4437 domain-containing protein [Scytonema sp. UIC 10036]MUG99484.1 DUF4437 domain-containing protein [Scytonema sp. UIC 10036]